MFSRKLWSKQLLPVPLFPIIINLNKNSHDGSSEDITALRIERSIKLSGESALKIKKWKNAAVFELPHHFLNDSAHICIDSEIPDRPDPARVNRCQNPGTVMLLTPWILPGAATIQMEMQVEYAQRGLGLPRARESSTQM